MLAARLFFRLLCDSQFFFGRLTKLFKLSLGMSLDT
jgi:hypothetical protein